MGAFTMRKNSTGTTGSSNVSKNFSTPISQLPNKLTATTFDSYLLIGKKGNNVAIYSNDDETTAENWLNEVGIGYDSEQLSQQPEAVS